jgi:hypothetical protein
MPIVKRRGTNDWSVEFTDPEISSVCWLLKEAKDAGVARNDGTWVAVDDLVKEFEVVVMDRAYDVLAGPGKF